MGGICEKQRGRFGLGPLAVISPSDSGNMLLPVSWLRVASAALASVTATWIQVPGKFLQPVQLYMLVKEVTTLVGSKYLFDVAC